MTHEKYLDVEISLGPFSSVYIRSYQKQLSRFLN